MRTMYLGTPSTPQSSWLILAVLVAAMLVAEYVGWFAPVLATTERSVIPLKTQITQESVHFFNSLSVIVSTSHNTVELRELRTEHSKALARIGELETIEKEYQDLQRIYSGNVGKQSIVSTLAPISSYTMPTLGIGEAAGIQKGSLVFDSGTLLGIVGQTTQQQARVRLLQQGDLELVAQTESGAQGIVRATGKTLFLQEVPSSLSVQRGERVSTVGQEGVPSGLLLGVITTEDSSSSSPSKSFVLEQLQSFFGTTLVEVRR
jgi:cell shape-determining protein MreC